MRKEYHEELFQDDNKKFDSPFAPIYHVKLGTKDDIKHLKTFQTNKHYRERELELRLPRFKKRNHKFFNKELRKFNEYPCDE